MLGPTLTKILSGQITLMARPTCPVCAAEGKAKAIQGRRWLCEENVAPVGGQPVTCRHIWDQVPLLGSDGQPATVTLQYALETREWRALLAIEVEQVLERLDPDESVEFMYQVLVGACDYEVMGQWIEVRTRASIDEKIPGGMALALLVKAALEGWVLPMLVDDYCDISPVSSTVATNGVSPVQPSGPTRSPGTRAPPRVARKG